MKGRVTSFLGLLAALAAFACDGTTADDDDDPTAGRANSGGSSGGVSGRTATDAGGSTSGNSGARCDCCELTEAQVIEAACATGNLVIRGTTTLCPDLLAYVAVAADEGGSGYVLRNGKVVGCSLPTENDYRTEGRVDFPECGDAGAVCSLCPESRSDEFEEPLPPECGK